MVSVPLRLGDDGLNVFAVIISEDATERVRAQVLDEGSRNRITIFHEQLFERVGIRKGSTVRHCSGGVDYGISAHTSRYLLVRAPLSNRVVVVPSQSEGIDF
jgi:hypothetical protein